MIGQVVDYQWDRGPIEYSGPEDASRFRLFLQGSMRQGCVIARMQIIKQASSLFYLLLCADKMPVLFFGWPLGLCRHSRA